jgi:hypothetical protein
MTLIRNFVAAACVVCTLLAGPTANAASIPLDASGWAFHNQGTAGGTVGGTLNSPVFTQADNVTVMAPFANAVQLANDGDFVEVSLTLQLGPRSGNSVGGNGMNTGLRIGLFNGPAGAIGAGDTGNLGILAQYMNTGGVVDEQTSSTGTNPFQSPTLAVIGNGGADSGGDSLQGATVGDVLFDLKLTRNAGKYDITGQISGTDSVSGNPYQSLINLPGYTPAALGFRFNRVGFFLNNKADGDSATTNANFMATLSNVTITTNVVPEPSSVILAVVLIGAAAVQWRDDSAKRRLVPVAV